MGNFKPPYGSRVNLGHPLARGLVGCWVMNEGSGNKLHDSISSSAGLMNGSGWAWKAAENGLVMDLGAASTNYALVAKTQSFDAQMANFSCAFTIKRVDDTNHARIFSKGGGATERLDLFWNRDSSGNKFAFDYYDSGGTFREDSSVQQITTIEPINVVITFNGTNTVFYFDGVKDSVSSNGVNIGATTGDLYIGVFNDASAHPFPGEIEYLWFWNRTLIDKEAYSINSNPYAMFEDPYPIELFGYVAAGGQSIVPIIMQEMNQFNGGISL